MNTEDDIHDDAGGEDISVLYRGADDAVPPGSLDQAILLAAKQAVDRTTATRGFPRAPFAGRWPIAASAAAVVVIAVMLVPLLEREAPPTESPPAAAVDEMRYSPERPEAGKAARERMPASGPARLYAPDYGAHPAPVLQHRAMEKPGTGDEDSAAGENMESGQARAQARLNAASGAPLAIFTPEMWLVKIRQLIDSGKIAEARDELDRFTRAHPGYELDQNLLERLKQP